MLKLHLSLTMSTTLIHHFAATNLSVLNTLYDTITHKPTIPFHFPITKFKSLTLTRCRLRVSETDVDCNKDGIFGKRDWRWMKRRRVVVVGGLNKGSGGGGGGGGGGLDSRVLGNLALAIGLTYLTMTGQIGVVFDAIGWVVDTLVSISLAVVILPIIGIGVFLWWAGKDAVQDTCPSCGQEFQTLKSLMIDELQTCPYCGQPFSVVEDKFVSRSGNSNSSPFGQIFNDFSPQSKKGQKVSSKVVDVEAEVRDVD